MEWKQKNLRRLAEIICGDADHFQYRSSSRITEFFADCNLPFIHDGSTRWRWVADRLVEILAQPHASPTVPPVAFLRVIRAVLDKSEAQDGDPDRSKARNALNAVLESEGWEAFQDDRGTIHLRHIDSDTVVHTDSPHRPLTPAEQERKNHLAAYLDRCSEDDLIAEVLLPLFRQLGFQRITATGHVDKALEYGKDVWMKYTLPTLHVLYFGIQAKKGKLDSAGVSKDGSVNIAEVHNQVNMMLGHEVFDPELSRRVLVDHAFIVAGGEITKQVRNWIGNKLDAHKRSQILFMDRDDILNLFTVTNMALPKGAAPPAIEPDFLGDKIPF